MPTVQRTVRGNKKKIIAELRELPKTIAGKSPDNSGVGRTFRANLFFFLFQKIREAFVAKSNWSQDEFGQSWKPIKPSTIAQRPLQAAKGLIGKDKIDRDKKGLLTPELTKLWNQVFARNFSKLASKVGPAAAKAQAARIAWATVKAKGGKTKLEVLGKRKVPMLRVSDRLLESLSPGVVSGDSYEPTPEQVAKFQSGELKVGTTVPYAKYLHAKRRLWPSVQNVKKWIASALQKTLPKLTDKVGK